MGSSSEAAFSADFGRCGLGRPEPRERPGRDVRILEFSARRSLLAGGVDEPGADLEPPGRGLAAPDRGVHLALEPGLQPARHLGLVLRPELGQPILPPDVGRLDPDRAGRGHDPVELVDHLLGLGEVDRVALPSLAPLAGAPVDHAGGSLVGADAGQACRQHDEEGQETGDGKDPGEPASDHGSLVSRPSDIVGHRMSNRRNFAGYSSNSACVRPDCKNYLKSRSVWPCPGFSSRVKSPSREMAIGLGRSGSATVRRENLPSVGPENSRRLVRGARPVSYRSFKHLLGETSLERKCRFIFGLGIFLLVTVSFLLYGLKTESLVRKQTTQTARMLVNATLMNIHYKKLGNENFESIIDVLWGDLKAAGRPAQLPRLRILNPYSTKDTKKQPADDFERITLARFLQAGHRRGCAAARRASRGRSPITSPTARRCGTSGSTRPRRSTSTSRR